MQVGELDWDLPHECLIGLDRRVENCLYAHIVFIQKSSNVSQGPPNCLFSLVGVGGIVVLSLWREFETNEMIVWFWCCCKKKLPKYQLSVGLPLLAWRLFQLTAMFVIEY